MRIFVTLLILIALFVISIPATVQAAPPGDGPRGLARAIAAQESHTDHLMSIPSVVGTAVGFNPEGKASVKILTERLGVAGLPNSLDGIPVEVVVTGKFCAREDPTARQDRPVPIGVSTGHPDITAGTIGARVTDGTNVYALSNNHVYANENDATINDDVIQPGTYDDGALPNDFIGTLSDFEPIDFSGGNNYMDAAIALSSVELLDDKTLSDGYGVPGADPVDAYISQPVQKYGRTTGLTQGNVEAINATVDVCYESLYGIFCVKSARFVGQIIITPGQFSDGGDSGSLIVTNDVNKNPVGLLFAGSDTYTIANPIVPILDRFGVSIDNSSGTIDASPSVNIINPNDGSTIQGIVSVKIDATDAEDTSGTLTVEWNVDGNEWKSTIYNPGTGYYEASWDSSSITDGIHTVNARATDSASNVTNISNSVLVDNVDEPPTANIITPADGSIISGMVIIRVASSDDRDVAGMLLVEVSIDSQGWQAATYNSASRYYELEWDTTSSPDGAYTIDARSTDSELQTSNASQIYVSINNSVTTMHVGDLDANSQKVKGGKWSASVTVTIHDSNHNPVSGAEVIGIWTDNNGVSFGLPSGVTENDGTVTFSTGNMRNSVSFVMFTVFEVTHSSLTYVLDDNHDPDGDCYVDGVIIIVYR